MNSGKLLKRLLSKSLEASVPQVFEAAGELPDEVEVELFQFFQAFVFCFWDGDGLHYGLLTALFYLNFTTLILSLLTNDQKTKALNRSIALQRPE